MRASGLGGITSLKQQLALTPSDTNNITCTTSQPAYDSPPPCSFISKVRADHVTFWQIPSLVNVSGILQNKLLFLRPSQHVHGGLMPCCPRFIWSAHMGRWVLDTLHTGPLRVMVWRKLPTRSSSSTGVCFDHISWCFFLVARPGTPSSIEAHLTQIKTMSSTLGRVDLDLLRDHLVCAVSIVEYQIPAKSVRSVISHIF